jgi:hypothetical protein
MIILETALRGAMATDIELWLENWFVVGIMFVELG